jgi:CDGSH-type Zn-finger protein
MAADVMADQLARVHAETAALADVLRSSDEEREVSAGQRLFDCVVRPLATAAGVDSGTGQAASLTDEPLWDRVWELAQVLTRLAGRSEAPTGLLQAAAGLQDLACEAAGPDDAVARAAELAALAAHPAAELRVVPGGPYLLTRVDDVTDHLGQSLPVWPRMTLCRCGASEVKPSCDGTCVRSGFSAELDPNRVPDRRDTYVGQQVTVLDNRGICQHSGYCTDRLSEVFHAGEGPFVTASGGRMDEIVRAVRDCPSGALSYAIDGIEAREQADHGHRRPPAVVVTRDGPYRLTGDIPVRDAAGGEITRNQGSSVEHCALCRCGHSQNKPFCSGMHHYVGFTDPPADEDAESTVFEWAGGLPAWTRMTRLFYEKHVPADPLLAPLFAEMSADHPERVASWLSEVFCGPRFYSQIYGGYERMLSQHIGKCLTEQQRARWVTLLMRSAVEAGLPNDAEFRSAFGSYIEWGSRLAVENSQTDSRPPEHMPMPHWDWLTAAGPPGSRVSALAPAEPEDEQPVVLPGVGEPVRFGEHIKPMFRARDRRSMRFAFDLWSCDDVCQHAEAILARLRDGSMPCDGAWPAEWIEVFARWADTGKAA